MTSSITCRCMLHCHRKLLMTLSIIVWPIMPIRCPITSGCFGPVAEPNRPVRFAFMAEKIASITLSIIDGNSTSTWPLKCCGNVLSYFIWHGGEDRFVELFLQNIDDYNLPALFHRSSVTNLHGLRFLFKYLGHFLVMFHPCVQTWGRFWSLVCAISLFMSPTLSRH